MKIAQSLLAAILLVAAVSAQSGPVILINGTNPPITISGKDPGSVVSLYAYDDPGDPTSIIGIYNAIADANGDAHFRPPVPENQSVIAFSDGATTTWEDLVTFPVVDMDSALSSGVLQLLVLFVEIIDGHEVWAADHLGFACTVTFIGGVPVSVDYAVDP